MPDDIDDQADDETGLTREIKVKMTDLEYAMLCELAADATRQTGGRMRFSLPVTMRTLIGTLHGIVFGQRSNGSN